MFILILQASNGHASCELRVLPRINRNRKQRKVQKYTTKVTMKINVHSGEKNGFPSQVSTFRVDNK